MKFTVRSNDLISAISKVISVTPTRSTLPILGNLFFNLEGKELTIIGSDLEVYIEVKMNVDGKTDGQVAIPAKTPMIFRCLRKLKSPVRLILTARF